jgi:hypothetical protein
MKTSRSSSGNTENIVYARNPYKTNECHQRNLRSINDLKILKSGTTKWLCCCHLFRLFVYWSTKCIYDQLDKESNQTVSINWWFLYLSSLFAQALTALGLQNNQIGDNGAQKLGDALKTNNVSYVFSKCLGNNGYCISTAHIKLFIVKCRIEDLPRKIFDALSLKSHECTTCSNEI